VGIEKRQNGEANLLVFDPKYHNVDKISRAIEGDIPATGRESFLEFYRRGQSYLERYSEFELLE
jgi:hypothetical protein